jgi:hypothetical protein
MANMTFAKIPKLYVQAKKIKSSNGLRKCPSPMILGFDVFN